MLRSSEEGADAHWQCQFEKVYADAKRANIPARRLLQHDISVVSPRGHVLGLWGIHYSPLGDHGAVCGCINPILMLLQNGDDTALTIIWYRPHEGLLWMSNKVVQRSLTAGVGTPKEIIFVAISASVDSIGIIYMPSSTRRGCRPCLAPLPKQRLPGARKRRGPGSVAIV